MNDLRKAAEMALETLCVGANDAVPNDIDERFEQAIEALRQALAHPDLAKVGEVGVWGNETVKSEHEPVAWCIVENGRVHGLVKSKPAVMNAEKWQPLYTAPPISDYHEGWEEGFKAAKKEWVGLTDEEMIELGKAYYTRPGDLMFAVEAKLKEKNNG